MPLIVGSYYRSPRGHLWRLDFITERDECIFYIPEIRTTSLPIPACLCQAFLDEVGEEVSAA